MSVRRRPRVEGDREIEILDACLELVVELGYDRLTMDAVAARARASKATLYRRWASKPTLVVDALVRAKGTPPDAVPDTGTLRGDLIAAFCGQTRPVIADTTAIIGTVVSAVATDPEFAALFRERFVGPKIAAFRQIYARAQERGEVGEDADLEIIAPALAAVLLHRAFVLGLPPTDDVVARVVDHLILPALAATRGDAPSP